MDNEKDDAYFLGKIKKDSNFILSHTKEINIDRLKLDEVLLDSIMFRLIQISENARKLTDEFRENNSLVEWIAIKGLRNRIVHD